MTIGILSAEVSTHRIGPIPQHPEKCRAIEHRRGQGEAQRNTRHARGTGAGRGMMGGECQQQAQQDPVMFENSKKLRRGSFVEPQDAPEAGSTIDSLRFRTLNWCRCNQFVV